METPTTGPLPPLSLTSDEIAAAREQIAAGLLPADVFEKHRLDCARAVYGHDHKVDRAGNPIEQGQGAAGHETGNHFAALKKAEAMGHELPGTYDKAVAALWKKDPDRARKLGLPGR
jgi:hypothetical protein